MPHGGTPVVPPPFDFPRLPLTQSAPVFVAPHLAGYSKDLATWWYIIAQQMKTDFKSVDEYIASFPAAVQSRLKKVRAIIRKEAREAEEQLAYGMPAYKLSGKPLVYFAGYKSHIGFYATPTGHSEFAKELSLYKQGKGSVQFPLDEPLPVELIQRIVEFRVKESQNKSGKAKSKSAK